MGRDLAAIDNDLRRQGYRRLCGECATPRNLLEQRLAVPLRALIR